jgi:hypothetical protein
MEDFMALETALVWPLLALVVLVFVVGLRMLAVRIKEMKEKRINPQQTATSLQMAARMENVQAADNFRNLFEVPVLFYALLAVAMALQHIPAWLVWGAWLFVALRYIHSLIHCTYNRVMHRFAAFGSGFLVIVVLWIYFVIDLTSGV